MPRKTGMYLAGVPCHLVQRGNNRDACFFADDDHNFYLEVFDAWGRPDQRVEPHALYLAIGKDALSR